MDNGIRSRVHNEEKWLGGFYTYRKRQRKVAERKRRHITYPASLRKWEVEQGLGGIKKEDIY